MIADIFARAGLKIPRLDEKTESDIQDWLGNYIDGTIVCNPIDLNVAGFDNKLIKKLILAFDESSSIDTIVIFEAIDFFISFAKKMKLEGLSKGFYKSFARLGKKVQKNVIVISVSVVKEAEVLEETFEIENLIRGSGIPLINSIEGAAKALAKVVNYKEYLERKM